MRGVVFGELLGGILAGHGRSRAGIPTDHPGPAGLRDSTGRSGSRTAALTPSMAATGVGNGVEPRQPRFPFSWVMTRLTHASTAASMPSVSWPAHFVVAPEGMMSALTCPAEHGGPVAPSEEEAGALRATNRLAAAVGDDGERRAGGARSGSCGSWAAASMRIRDVLRLRPCWRWLGATTDPTRSLSPAIAGK